MKQVIFLCLLSLTLCLSRPDELQGPTLTNATGEKGIPTVVAPAPSDAVTKDIQTTLKSVPSSIPTTPKPANNDTAQSVINTNEATIPTNTNNTTTDKKDNATSAITVVTTTIPTTDKATDVHKESATTELKPSINDGAKTADGQNPKNDTVTPTTSPTTEAPKTPKSDATPKTDEDKHIVQARGFDGPSFIGGIILTLGILAIGFMGFKYYKNQTERNYHTL